MGRRRFLDGARRRASTPILAALLVASAASASAATLRWRAPVQESEASTDSFVPADRALLRQWSQGKAWLEQRRYSDAIRCLQSVLEAPDDYFFRPDAQTPTHHSLKAEARRLIGQLPPEGRRLYELQCGHKARRLLDEAVASGEAAKLAEASARYFHTQAGYEATFLLGLYNLDHGLPLAGALSLRRLREAGEDADRFEPALTLAMAAGWLEAGSPEEARRALAALKERQSARSVIVGGREVQWFRDGAETIPWLAQLIGPRQAAPGPEQDRWLMFRGDAARNAAGVGSAPLLSLCWRIPLVGDGDGLPEAEVLRQQQQQVRREGKVVFPALHPLVVGDVVLMRNLRTLLAVDLASGKRLWEVPADDPLDAADLREPDEQMSWRPGYSPYQGLAVRMGQRLWQDGVYGTLSSDGRLVFSIEDLPLASGYAGSDRGSCNRLAAHDLRTGKLKWNVGGRRGAHALRLAETFFLGPPLPLRGQLYALAEVNDEVRLLVLDADSGNFCWSQQLTMVERNSLPDVMRRTVGLSPSYADGVLICPVGPVVAVDLATHSLLWGFRGGADAARNRSGQHRVIFGGMGNVVAAYDGGRWLEPTATVADGRVLATFPLDDAIYCLSLADGKPLWEAAARTDELYVACVHAGNVVVVRRSGLSALRLADGKPAWVAPLPVGVEPSGRGFYAGSRYFLPLRSAEAAVVDLDAGKIVQISKSREGRAPGNLVYSQGKVISQGVDGLEVYYQAEALRAEVSRRLAVNPEDAFALSLQGQMLLDEGKLAAAAANFRRAWKLGGDERARQLLRDTLLEGLRSDFAAYRARADEIEPLLDNAAERALFLRLTAGGLQKAGESLPALEQFLRLVDLERGDGGLEEVDRSLLVRRERLIQVGLAALRREASAKAAAEIDRIIGLRLQTAVEAKSTETLRRFVECFQGQPAAETARRELISRLAADKHWLEAELLLWRDRQSPSPAVAGRAVAQLAQILEQAGSLAGAPVERLEGAAVCCRQLQSQFADVVCRDGKTGKQLYAAAAASASLGRHLRDEAPWPIGEVEVKKLPRQIMRPEDFGRFSIGCDGDRGPFFAQTVVRFNQNQRRVEGADAYGRDQWRVQLSDDGNIFGYNNNTTTTHILGHLMVIPIGQRLVAIDPLGLAGGEDKVLWARDLADAEANAAATRVLGAGRNNLNNVVFLGGAPFNQFQFGRNVVGAVTSRYVCFQWMQNLTAVDPLTGQTLWVRRNIPPGSWVFGDDEVVAVAPPPFSGLTAAALPPAAPQQEQLMLLRAEDGGLLGFRKAPPLGVLADESGNGPMPMAAAGGIFRLAMPLGGVFGSAPGASPAANPICFGAVGRKMLFRQPAGDGRQVKLEMLDPLTKETLWSSPALSRPVKVSMWNDEMLGALAGDGRFLLFELASGRIVADVSVSAGDATGMRLLRSGDEYLLLLLRNRPQKPGAFAQALPGAQEFGPSGRLYAIDGKGKLMWPGPVEFEDAFFLQNQPERIPAIFFAGQQWEQRKNGRMQMTRRVLCVDKRTGRTLYSSSSDRSRQAITLDIDADPANRVVTMRMNDETLELTFTDKPVKPAAAAAKDAGNKKPARSTAGSELLKALLGLKDEEGEDPFGQ